MTPLSNFGGPEMKGDKWRIKKLNLHWGLSDDPIDEFLTAGLYWAFVDADPDVGGERGSPFVWTSNINYRVLTSVGVIQVIEFVDIDLDDEKTYEGSHFGREHLMLGAASSVASAITMRGTITYETTLVQRQLKDDFSEYEGDFTFEESLDEEENQHQNVI